jgi:hypothetical protein
MGFYQPSKNTWDTKKHLINEKAEGLIVTNQAATEQRQRGVFQGNLIETG